MSGNWCMPNITNVRKECKCTIDLDTCIKRISQCMYYQQVQLGLKIVCRNGYTCDWCPSYYIRHDCTDD